MNQQNKTVEKERILDILQPGNQQDALAQAQKKKAQESKPFSFWLEKNHYYHHRLKKFYKFAIPEGMRVLAIQCKNGYLLDAVKPSFGVGVDTDLAMVEEAKQTYARHRFYHGTIAQVQETAPFDYIMISSAILDIYDVQSLFESLKPFCHAGTRIVIDMYVTLWQPLVWCAQKLKLSGASTPKNWLAQEDVLNLLYLSGYQPVEESFFMLLPVYLPIISTLFNAILAHVPGIKRLCMHRAIVARPLFVNRDNQEYTVSVIIPCKNEKANIESVVKRTPQMGKFTELIFVCGNSTDGTYDEIKRVAQKYPDRSISVYKQKETGKGDALRLGFEYAIGDIVMILDADSTVPPEELPKFFYALIENKGECINGSRMIYSMEHKAMRTLNYIINRCLSGIFSWILGQRVKDTLCGTKVLWKEDYQMIVRNRAFFGNFDPFGDFDLLLGAAKLHLKLTDLPVHYKCRRFGTTQINRFHCGLKLCIVTLFAMKRFKFK